MSNSSNANQINEVAVRWITAAELARLTGLSEQTLANWRLADRRAGCPGGRPGYPRWRSFGRAVRYVIKRNGEPEVVA